MKKNEIIFFIYWMQPKWYGIVVYGEDSYVSDFKTQYSKDEMIKMIIDAYQEIFEDIGDIDVIFDYPINVEIGFESFNDIDPCFVEFMRDFIYINHTLKYNFDTFITKIYMFSYKEIVDYIEKFKDD